MPVVLKCVICGAEFSVCPHRAETAKYCNYRCHQVGEGRKAGAVRAGQMKEKSQRRTYVKSNGRHEHRRIVEELLGRRLGPDEIVHHKDGNKFNNEFWNLQLVTRQEHARIHFHPNKRKAV